MTKEHAQLREKDRVVLQCIQDGKDDTHEITQATTFKDYEVRYSFEKLEEHGLIKLEKPEGTVERVTNGQKRVFKAPWKVELTNSGEDHLARNDEQDLDSYEDLSHAELVAKVHQLEQEVEQLHQNLEAFRKQVQNHL